MTKTSKNEILKIVKLLRENSELRLNWLESKGAGLSELAKKVQRDYIGNVILLLDLFENWQKSPEGRLRPEAQKISYPDLCLSLAHAKERGIIDDFKLCRFTIEISRTDADNEKITIHIPHEISPLDFSYLIIDFKYLQEISK